MDNLLITTYAIEYLASSASDKKILNFLILNFCLINNLIFLLIKISGLPNKLFFIEISLKFIPFLKPIPNDLTKASFAANLLAKKLTLLFIFF